MFFRKWKVFLNPPSSKNISAFPLVSQQNPEGLQPPPKQIETIDERLGMRLHPTPPPPLTHLRNLFTSSSAKHLVLWTVDVTGQRWKSRERFGLTGWSCRHFNPRQTWNEQAQRISNQSGVRVFCFLGNKQNHAF